LLKLAQQGRSALLIAPTGAGKTIVGEFAVHLAMQTPGDKAFYTTPIKALSNQKFRELTDEFQVPNISMQPPARVSLPRARVPLARHSASGGH
jgi:superfamily II RNA helicase